MAMMLEGDDVKMPKPALEMEVEYGEHDGKWGVLISVQSKVFEDLFKKISGGKIQHVKKNGVEGDFYDFPLLQNDRTFSDLLPQVALFQREAPGVPQTVALYFLRIPGLSKGVKIFFPGIFEADTIKKYAGKVGERAEFFYKKLSPGNVKMKLWLGDFKGE